LTACFILDEAPAESRVGFPGSISGWAARIVRIGSPMPVFIPMRIAQVMWYARQIPPIVLNIHANIPMEFFWNRNKPVTVLVEQIFRSVTNRC
jgi:hypothetical protein